MRKATILFSLFIFITGCGDLAPTDAQVNGPENSTETANAGQTITFPALEFTVKNKEGIALPRVEIEFFAGGTGHLLETSSSTFKTKTDDKGLARVSYQITARTCNGATTDQIETGSVRGTVGSDSGHLWKATITIKCP